MSKEVVVMVEEKRQTAISGNSRYEIIRRLISSLNGLVAK